jgi:hypothetical protein
MIQNQLNKKYGIKQSQNTLSFTFKNGGYYYPACVLFLIGWCFDIIKPFNSDMGCCHRNSHLSFVQHFCKNVLQRDYGGGADALM